MQKPLHFLIDDLLIILNEGKPMKRRRPFIPRIIFILMFIISFMVFLYITLRYFR
jgi:hypothetical protein